MTRVPLTRTGVKFLPDARRVITRPFIPGDDVSAAGRSRMRGILRRILDLPDALVVSTLAVTRERFSARHADLETVLERSFAAVAHHVDDPGALSLERRQLIGAYFTSEFSIEAAALTNPSLVPAPEQGGVAAGACRFVLSLRGIGEGHVSSIQFRAGVIDAEGQITLEQPGVRLRTAARTVPLFDPPDFAAKLASSNYRVSFDPASTLSERILFPAGPTESHGMEDARFVRFADDDGVITYYASYTAYDGDQVLPQLIETTDFLHFKVQALNGPCAINKGIALFPRKLDGRFVALARLDNENNHVIRSDSVYSWCERETLQSPVQPWELVQLGNCGSPLETEAGWLVITHGVGPLRQYVLGAILLDARDPGRIVGRLREPLLVPSEDERNGYTPNVVYSCGSMILGDRLFLPYGFSDTGASIATLRVSDLLTELVRQDSSAS